MEIEKIFENPIDGCVFIHPDSRQEKETVFMKGKYLDRIKIWMKFHLHT